MYIIPSRSDIVRSLSRLRWNLSCWRGNLTYRAMTGGMALRNRLPGKKLIDDGNAPIVSLTSFGSRLATVHIVIETLFLQSAPPAAIYLWLHENDIQPGGVPRSLRRLQRRGLHIEFVPDDLKGAKKLVYAAQRFPERTIVTADDDLLYPRDWLSGLLKKSKANPQDVIAYRAWFLRLEKPARLKSYVEIMDDADGGDETSFNIFPTGCAGVLYPPGSLNEKIGNVELMMRLCPGADDIWFKAMTMLNGVRSKRVYAKNYMPQRLDVGGSALWDVNMEKNDYYLKNTFDYFDLYRLL